jgi:tetratricopeptide (TPR) repeat protein
LWLAAYDHQMATGQDRQDLDPDQLLALALSRPTEALATARAVLSASPTAAEAAVAHQAAGVVLRDFGDIRQAVSELRAAAGYARRAGDRDREADIRASLGVALVMSGDTRLGLATLETAVRTSSGVLTGRILIRRVWIFLLLGRNIEAMVDARRALDLLSGTGDLVWEARAFQQRASAHLALGATDQADDDNARAEALYAESGQQLEYASARQERGATAFARGDLPTALAHLDHAQAIVDELGIFEAELFVTKGTVLLAAGLHREALAEVDGAITRIERQGGSATRRAELLYCAALAAYAAGDLAVAQRRSLDALRLFRRQQRPWWAARTELVLLQCRSAAGGGSAPLLRRAERVTAELDGLDPERAVLGHLLTAQLASQQGHLARSRDHLRSAARGRRQGMQTRSSGWLAQAILSEGEGNSRGMLAACDRGLQQLDMYLRTLGATELRVLATAQGAELATLALRYAVGRGNARQVLEWSERWRATTLAVPPMRPPADDDLVADLAALRGLTRRLDSGADRNRGLDGLQRERSRLEAAVRQRVLHTPGMIAADTPVFRCADLLEQLGEATLIELTEVDGVLFAVLAKRGRVSLRPVGPAAAAAGSLAHSLFALRREGSGRGSIRLDLDQIGARLESDLLGGAVMLLHDEPVVMVPTGRLHAVPWGLLPSLRERSTTVMPSASAWIRARRAVPPPGARVVLVGGPHLSTGAEEVRRLALQYPKSVVLTEGSATVERVMNAIDGAWLVHIAAHGTFRSDSPLFSALELDDGPLTVYDLERLGRAPHRVILSSCSSAVGAPTGSDELLGVVSALIALGSAGVVASVVPVNDPATVPFMLALHRNLQAGGTLAEALALARRVESRRDVLTRTAADSFIALGV